MRAWRPTRTPGIRMVREISQKLCTRTLGHRMLPAIRLPEMMQPFDTIESSAWPQRMRFFGEDELGRRRLRLIGRSGHSGS